MVTGNAILKLNLINYWEKFKTSKKELKLIKKQS
jgi:hypothetical protein